jgi:hypothetical protein
VRAPRLGHRVDCRQEFPGRRLIAHLCLHARMHLLCAFCWICKSCVRHAMAMAIAWTVIRILGQAFNCTPAPARVHAPIVCFLLDMRIMRAPVSYQLLELCVRFPLPALQVPQHWLYPGIWGMHQQVHACLCTRACPCGQLLLYTCC